jgi:hypothetical protein
VQPERAPGITHRLHCAQTGAQREEVMNYVYQVVADTSYTMFVGAGANRVSCSSHHDEEEILGTFSTHEKAVDFIYINLWKLPYKEEQLSIKKYKVD